ncbi:RNA-directed DNA polymerase, eukaryota, reverse transcriptase zinc-binding domain protein [Tanacetum coccineum]
MVYARCPLDATVLHDSTANSLHDNSTGLSHLLGPFEFGPSGSGSRHNNFVQPPMLPRGLDFQWSWYRTPRSPIELQELSGLVELVTHLHLTNDSDKWTCVLSDSKDFSVRAMRIHISNTTSLLPEVPYRWNNILPSKVNISSWRIFHRRLPTRLNLDKRGIDLDSVLCPICNDNPESEDHIFVECCIAKSTWFEFQGNGVVAMDGDDRRRWRPLFIDLNDLLPVDDDDVARARRAQANDPVTNVDSEWTTQELNFWILPSPPPHISVFTVGALFAADYLTVS